jgi:hypothetical protein
MPVRLAAVKPASVKSRNRLSASATALWSFGSNWKSCFGHHRRHQKHDVFSTTVQGSGKRKRSATSRASVKRIRRRAGGSLPEPRGYPRHDDRTEQQPEHQRENRDHRSYKQHAGRPHYRSLREMHPPRAVIGRSIIPRRDQSRCRMCRELVPRFRNLQQHGSLFWRARTPSHRTALVAVLAVLFSCLHDRRTTDGGNSFQRLGWAAVGRPRPGGRASGGLLKRSGSQSQS